MPRIVRGERGTAAEGRGWVGGGGGVARLAS